jgi:hypothetical protein
MGPSQLVNVAVAAGICIGAGLFLCLQGQSESQVLLGAGAIILGAVVQMGCMVRAERVEER